MKSQRIVVAAAAIALAISGLASGELVSAAEPRDPTPAVGFLRGKSLAEALQELGTLGLKLVFTTNVVRPSMLIETEPAADRSDLRALLDEILDPHGLETRSAPNQTLVVVPRGTPEVDVPPASEGSIVGFVRSSRDSMPIEGVTLRVLETDLEARSGADGGFAIRGLDNGTVAIEVRRRGFVVEVVAGVPVVAGQVTELPILLNPAPVTEEELLVTPSRVSLLRQEPAASVSLSRDDILALPHLGDDFFRALSLLPGIAAGDVSAQFHIRGGRRDETRIILDGQELYDTFHLKEFDSALSIVASTTLASVDLSTGGFSAEHGDRMSGVLDMTTLTPTGPPRFRLGVGVLGAEAGGAGSTKGQRLSWIAHARRGANDFAGKLLGPERPVYWDSFGKLDFQVRAGHGLRANVLHSEDSYAYGEVTPDGGKRIDTAYRSSYSWITDQVIIGPDLFLDTALSRSRIDRDRNGVELDLETQWEVVDRRELEVLSLRQNWSFQASPRHYLKWGFELRDFDSRYDYRSSFAFDSPVALLRTNSPAGSIRFQARFDETHDSAYLSDRINLGRSATLELGLRFDEHSQTDEGRLTPRMNFACAIGRATLLRAAWGEFNQSQRPYELQVEDGGTRFHPIERSEHRLAGFEHFFQRARRADLTLRVELYQREIANPQPRWENLYEPLNEFQETEPDRVRIAPDRSVSEGIEWYLRGRAGNKVTWFANYSLASTEDRVGGAHQYRRFDQTHSLNLDVDFRFNESWTLNLAWRYHTGWPTTPFSIVEVVQPTPELEDGPQDESEDEGRQEGNGDEPGSVFVPVLGRPFSERLSDYHRLDLRASRRWELPSGRLTFFADVQNAYDRKNLAGFDYEIDEDDGTVIANPETWRGFFPSFGIRWEF